MEEIFYDIFQGVPRQSPGSNTATKRAIDLIDSLPVFPNILDIGCGTGTQTLQLAHHLGGTIYALDNHTPYLRNLTESAQKLGYNDSIQTVHGDMHNLNFSQEFFDLIWSEGAIYIMGFREGLDYLKTFLKKSGYLAVTEISWLRNNQPQLLKDFWEQEYEAMNCIEENFEIIRDLGYELVNYFILSSETWWDNYYIPLENRLVHMRRKYIENDQALELIEFIQLEIDLYRKYPEFYGFVFYIMKKL